MNKKSTSLLTVTAFALLLTVRSGWAEETNSYDKELSDSLKSVKVTLAKGLEAGAAKGKPISGKFEIEHGKLQLSVYTAKGDSFHEVVVNQKSGKVVKSEAITDGYDLVNAKSQNNAMAIAKISLAAAVKKALKANKGFVVVSAIASLQEGQSVAEITLLDAKGSEKRFITEKMD